MDDNTTTNQVTTPEVQPENPQVEKKTSALPPKKTIILIVALVLITVALVYLSIAFSPKDKTATTPTTTNELSYAQTHFELSSVPALDPISSKSAVSVYTLDLSMRTGENNITAVQFEIQYDPLAITDIDIYPTENFKDWAQLTKKIDAENGTISYALGMSPGRKSVKGSNVVAKMVFSKVNGYDGNTKITFLPKTMATAEGQDNSVLKSATGAIFAIENESSYNTTE